MVPLDPGEAVAGGVPGRLHVEVASFAEAPRPVASMGVDHGDAIHILIGVDVGDPAAIGRNDGCRGGAKGRSDRPGAATSQLLAVDALIGLADEVGDAVREGEIAAAVADESAHGDIGGEVAGCLLAGPLGDDDATVGATFNPGEGLAVAVPTGFVQAEPACKHAGRDGAGPEAVHAVFAGHGGGSVRGCGNCGSDAVWRPPRQAVRGVELPLAGEPGRGSTDARCCRGRPPRSRCWRAIGRG